MDAEGRELLANRLAKESSERYGCEFGVVSRRDFWICRRPSRDYFKGQGLMYTYTQADINDVYFEGKRFIKWPDGWIDPYPISVETVTISRDQIEIEMEGFDLHFLCKYYYALWPLLLLFSNEDSMTVMLSEREDRMKAARIMPAVIKDIEVFLKSLRSSLERWNVSQREAKCDFSELEVSLKFDIVGMNDEQIINEVLKRTEALTEHLKRMKTEWFPSEERRKYYEETKLFRDDPFRERIWSRVICKWPLKRDREFDKKYEDVVRDELIESLKDPRHKVYNLDGYKLRLS